MKNDLTVSGEDLLISRSLCKLESGRFTLQTLRRELAYFEQSGKKINRARLQRLAGLANTALSALNDLSWRLQLRAKGGNNRYVSPLVIEPDLSYPGSTDRVHSIASGPTENTSLAALQARYDELALRRRILAEEFNGMADQVLSLRRSRLYTIGKLISPRGCQTIDSMVEIATAVKTNEIK